jgi:FAD/FMN-containing dehydrogenase
LKNKIQQYSWGLYPKIKCKSLKFTEINELRNIVTKENHIIAHGNGRSYGDSALNKKIIDCTAYNKVISFDKERGTLKAQAGILLDDILELIIPEGWFLKVTPGTKMITLGGAIASDVHGKNHHIDGCFSESVLNFSIMDKEGIIKKCLKNDELFLSTCGGMGLTGVIVDAEILLEKINSQNMNITNIKSNHLKETFKIFENNKNAKYSVAWIDSTSKGSKLGRGVVSIGKFANDDDLKYIKPKILSITKYIPSFFIIIKIYLKLTLEL